MNYNFHQSLEEKRHRFLNAVAPGMIIPIHRRPTKDESFVVLRGENVLFREIIKYGKKNLPLPRAYERGGN
jgi:cupin fold WbuC family metalloprotein